MAPRNIRPGAKLVKWDHSSNLEFKNNNHHSNSTPTTNNVPFNLLTSRKLVLLVDLDQTLIDTTQAKVPLGIADVHHFQSGGSWYHTRVRPGTKAFLKNMSELFEMHIWTYSDRPYSNQIACLLDPHCTLFSRRILTRDEFIDPYSKNANLKQFFPNGDSMVCMIDDQADAWNHAPNLVPVKPYIFFTDTVYKDQEEKEKKDYLLELHKHDNDDHLIYLEEKLRGVHGQFYKMYDEMKMKKNGCIFPDVKELVRRARANVLEFVNVVFSGILPTEMQKMWTLAQSLGASIRNEPVAFPDNKPTTHVVIGRLDTDKVRAALKFKNVHVVNPNWLRCCAERWHKVDEMLFPVVSRGNKILPTVKPLLDIRFIDENIARVKQGVKNKRQELDSEEESLNPRKRHQLNIRDKKKKNIWSSRRGRIMSNIIDSADLATFFHHLKNLKNNRLK